MSLAEYFATLPFKPQDKPELITYEKRPDVVGPDPARVGKFKPTKIVRGPDVAVVSDFAKDPGSLLDLPGLPTDDMDALKKLVARSPAEEPEPQFQPGPMLKDLSFDRPINSLADFLAAANQQRQEEKDALFREALLKQGLTPEEVRSAEVAERVARVKASREAARMPVPAAVARGEPPAAAGAGAPPMGGAGARAGRPRQLPEFTRQQQTAYETAIARLRREAPGLTAEEKRERAIREVEIRFGVVFER